MSHSVFKDFPGTHTTTTTTTTASRASAAAATEQQTTTPVSDGRDNVVIVLNKDGSVSVDQHALHTFLRDDKGKTAVSVVRVQSPTPSLVEELREQGPSSDDDYSSNDEQQPNSDATDANDSNSEDRSSDENDTDGGDSGEEELDSEDNSASGGARRRGKTNTNVKAGVGKRRKNRKQKERPPHVRLTVEQYLAPDQAKIFAAEILQYAGMSSGLSLDVDYDYQRFVVQNDHCYTPLTSPKARAEPSKSTSAQESNKRGGSAAAATATKDTGKAARRRQTEAKSTPTALPAVITSRRGRQIIKPTSKVIELISDDDEEIDEETAEGEGSEEADGDEDYQTDDEDYSASESENDRDSDLDFRVNSNYLPKKKKSHNSSNNSKPPQSKGESKQQPHHQTGTSSTKASHNQSAGAGSLNTSRSSGGAAAPLKQGLKQRQLFSAGTSGDRQLQQTKLPVHKVKAQLPATQQGYPRPQTQAVPLKPRPAQPPIVISTASAFNQRRERVAAPSTAQTAALKQDPLYSDMRSLFATPDIIKKVAAKEPTDSQQGIHLPAAFDLDLISSIVDEADGGMETRKGAAAAAAVAAMMSDKSVAADTLDLNDTSLLDEIVGDDGLPEELLQHVAALVENKSLQEVIDKQVLGVEDPMATLTSLLPKPVPMQQPATPVMMHQQQPRKESPFVKLAQQKQLAKQSAAAAASLTAPRKEPIKIVRSDGRVITLPPIEAPTTRGAKRRAQNNPDSSTTSPVMMLTASPKSGAGMGTPTSSAPRDPDDSQMVEILSPNVMADIGAPVSARKKSGSERGSTSRRASTTPSVAESDMDMEFNSEDDPDRLWCICKQPHNNRFMICCDTCEDWFHGKCVNITKAMGQQMEAAGREWTCPNCVQGLSGTEQVCLVCHRKAKPDSVFCSNECIVKHANKTQSQQPQHSNNPLQMPKVVQLTAPKSSAPRIVSGKVAEGGAEAGKVRIGLLKNAQGRVIVYHKKTKQCLSGDNAPFLAQIKEWLAANPDYAIVAPGSEVAEAFKAKQAQLQQLKVRQAMQGKQGAGDQSPGVVGNEKSLQSKLKFGTNKQMVIVHPKTAQQIKVAPTGKSSPTTAERTTPFKAVKAEGASGASPSTPMGQRQVQRGEVEPIRLTVRKTLKEQLAQRMVEVREGGAKLGAEEIEQFALDTEQEMFALFNKDTGHKYKAKYRSLMFNIKDRKNETLFKKICERGVKPYRLVRMSPEDLASQELAKWRENENKHQLDMIKKSELDLLACAKTYVLKSHKGEVEVMESMMGENAIGTVDDVTMLSGMNKDGETEVGELAADGRDSRRHDRKRERSRDKDSNKHRSHHSGTTSSSSSLKHHKRKRSRERSRERDKDRAKEKGASGSSNSSKHKTSSSSSHHSHSHHVGSSKDKEKGGGGGGGKKEGASSSSNSSRHHHHHKDKVHSIKEESNHSPSPTSSNHSSSNHKSSDAGGTITGLSAGQVFKPSKKETEESYDLIEKILQETSPELVAKLHEMEKQKAIEENAGGDQPDVQQIKLEAEPAAETKAGDDAEEYDPEALAPHHPKGLWSGRVVYHEIAQFQGVVLPLYGETADVLSDFPTSFEVQGRIGPEVVWDYLSKIKRSVNRDITVVRFAPRSAKDHAAYETMYSYFETKGRLGVLKPKSDVIKDFYLVPQKKGRLLPSVLLTLKGLGGYETKANCIVGIVVKATLKRPSSSGSGATQAKLAKKTSQVAAVVREEGQQFTPPGSPKLPSHKLLAGLPTVETTTATSVIGKADDDEPYSPGGSEEEDSAMDAVPLVAPPAPAIVPSELQKEVDRLNRQIEAQKNEIVEMLSKDPLEEEPYSPSRPVSDSSKDKVASIPLANISIPSNLQEILASLKNVGAAPQHQHQASVDRQVDEEEDDDEYNPLPISSSTQMSTETYKPRPTSPSTRAFLLAQEEQSAEVIPFLSSSSSAAVGNSGPSKLSYMTDDELMRLVPDGVDLSPPLPPSQQQGILHLGGGEGVGGIPGLGDGNDEEYDPEQ